MKTLASPLSIALIVAASACAPAYAQHHGGHAQPKASAQGSTCTPEHAAMGHCTMPSQPATHADHDTSGDPGCTPEHAAMGHCTMPAQPATHADHDTSGDPGCTPEHAAMGHCTMPSNAPTEPREPIPVLTDADRAAAFPVLHADHGHGSATHWFLRFNRFEAWDADHGTGQAWSGSLWVGGDINRLLVKSSGERSGGQTRSANAEVLYSRAVTPWWELVGGVKQEIQSDSRTWGAIGVQGLAPYMFELSAMTYVADGGWV